MPKQPKDSTLSLPSESAPAHTPENTKKKREISPYLTTAEKARIEALYVVKGLPPRDVAAAIGRKVEHVSQYIYRVKLPEKREARAQRLSIKENANAETELQAAFKRWSARSESNIETAWDRIEETLKSNSKTASKDFANYSSGARNLFGLYKDTNGVKTGTETVNPAQVNIFVGSLERAEPKPADKPIDV